ncbi:MAG: metal-dependent hydrolase [Myxococcales bacterium]|nr:metal-dependent hydrolase [Myxococcales bacterium]
MDLKGVKITWLGHSTFVLQTPAGKKVLVDPWLEGNPKCPAAHHETASDAILCTHGHNDHIGDAVSAFGRCSGPLVGIFELVTWLSSKKGLAGDRMVGMNHGGSTKLGDVGVTVTMTDARHSSTFVEADGTFVPLGNPAGYVIGFEGGLKVYHAGDTCLFGDMALIKELWAPDVAILPIGDHFTMCPRQAAYAAEMLGVKAVLPCHYGTFGLLTGTPAALKEELGKRGLGGKVEVITLEPGGTVG